MSTLELQLMERARPQNEACWNEIGVQGNRTCAKLEEVIHCRNCPVYSKAGLQLLDRPLLPEYRRVWTEHFAHEKPTAVPPRSSALVFRISSDWLALPTQAFREVAERGLVHSLPHRRQGIVLGLVSIRGELLTCVSLGQFLGLYNGQPQTGRRSNCHRLLVAQWDRHHFVFPADEVRGIHHFLRTELIDPPATLANARLAYTKGILAWQSRAVGLLNADLLFPSLNRSLM
jgi:chemotaxis-related protein WspD